MTETILKLYDYLRQHRLVGLVSFVVVTLLLTVSVLRLGYKEDIADFLPVDSNHHNALKVYQDISGANKIFAVFQYRDTTKRDADAMVTAVDAFVDEVQRADTAHIVQNMTSQVDLEKMTSVTNSSIRTSHISLLSMIMPVWTVLFVVLDTLKSSFSKTSRC